MNKYPQLENIVDNSGLIFCDYFTIDFLNNLHKMFGHITKNDSKQPELFDDKSYPYLYIVSMLINMGFVTSLHPVKSPCLTLEGMLLLEEVNKISDEEFKEIIKARGIDCE